MIKISVNQQTLSLYQEGEVVAQYVISTAANGVGSEEGSYCTPTGNFKISEKWGAGAELGTIFKARKPAGLWRGDASEHDLVLTRILRLHGLDAENANTMERYIYIHGTNQEALLGQAVSCGCIRMSNTDIIDLFERVNVGERVVLN